MDTDDTRIEGIVIALLDFPKGGTFGLDGQSIVLKTDDFVGVKNIPRNAFHLMTCKNGHGSSLLNDSNNPNTINTAVTVGFLVFGDDGIDNHRGNSSGHLVRNYDPQTEEVASEERYRVDEITKRNIIQHMTDGSLPSSRVLRYDQIVSGGSGNTNQEEQLFSGQRVWREQTRYIRKDLLKDIRGLSSGDKIVPGCYDPEDETKKNSANPPTSTTTTMASTENDGKSLTYPPIPVVDPRLSLAKHKHHGTKRFLSRLEPWERTKLFLSSSAAAASESASNNNPNFVWLDRVLKDCYRGSWETLLGDLQLSYVLFLYLGCYSSLEHWKDLLAMLSLAIDGIVGEGNRNRERSRHRHESLFRSLLRLLPYQLSSMNDPEFLENIDEGGGNFLIPSLARLKGYYETERQPESNTVIQDPEEEEELELLSKFRHVLSSKFPQTFVFRPSVPTITRIRSNSYDSDEGNGNGGTDDTANHTMDVDSGDEDEEDGPVVVSPEEIEASMARSSVGVATGAAAAAVTARDATITKQLRTEYPLLAAAMMSSEDVLMTCARALDEKTDVSLVREAAAYLEEVEEQPRGFY